MKHRAVQRAKLLTLLPVLGTRAVFSSCAMVQDTPAQKLAWERWAQCRQPGMQLQRIETSGKIWVTPDSPAHFEAFSTCNREAAVRQETAVASIRATESSEVTALLTKAAELARSRQLGSPQSLQEARGGRVDEATTFWRDALDLARALDDALQVYEILGALADSARNAGRIDEAIERRTEQLAILDAHGGRLSRSLDAHTTSAVLLGLAWDHIRRGQSETALPFAERAVREVTRPSSTSYRSHVAEVWNVYGEVNRALHRWDAAEKAFREALAIWSADDNKGGIAAGLH